MTSEIQGKTPDKIVIKVHSTENKDLDSWEGGSYLALLKDHYSNLWITKEEYEETGP